MVSGVRNGVFCNISVVGPCTNDGLIVLIIRDSLEFKALAAGEPEPSDSVRTAFWGPKSCVHDKLPLVKELSFERFWEKEPPVFSIPPAGKFERSSVGRKRLGRRLCPMLLDCPVGIKDSKTIISNAVSLYILYNLVQ